MDLDAQGDTGSDVMQRFQGSMIDVPVQLDVFPDGQPTLTIGDVAGYADFNHKQGDNPQGFTEDCGLVSCSDVLNQFGIHVTEADVVGHAIQYGECNVIPGSPAGSGGTSPADQARLLTDYGVPAHCESNQSIEQLATAIEQGHGVIASVNAGVLWDQPQYVQGGGNNHAVTVTGVARDLGTGAIQGFYINDSGTGQSAEFVPVAVMTHAFQDTGGSFVETDNVHVETAQ
jgi:Peptidase_C39 like family